MQIISKCFCATKSIILLCILYIFLATSCEQELEIYTLPFPVNSLSVTPGSQTARLNWLNPSDTRKLQGLRISWVIAGKETNPAPENTIDLPTLLKTYTVSNLLPSTKYTFTVKILDSYNYESAGVEITGTTSVGAREIF